MDNKQYIVKVEFNNMDKTFFMYSNESKMSQQLRIIAEKMANEMLYVKHIPCRTQTRSIITKDKFTTNENLFEYNVSIYNEMTNETYKLNFIIEEIRHENDNSKIDNLIELIEKEDKYVYEVKYESEKKYLNIYKYVYEEKNDFLNGLTIKERDGILYKYFNDKYNNVSTYKTVKGLYKSLGYDSERISGVRFVVINILSKFNLLHLRADGDK